jgi:hypothetical protein
MLEIIIMIGVMGWFWRTARSDGASPGYGAIWVIGGGLSYFLPANLIAIVVYPALAKSFVTSQNYFFFVLLGIILSVGIGAACCFLARKVLLAQIAAARKVDAPTSTSADKYYGLLARTVAGLDDDTPQARRELYERARGALHRQLRAQSPPLGEAAIAHEREALDAAIHKLDLATPRPDARTGVIADRAKPRIAAAGEQPVPAVGPSRRFAERDNVGTRYETQERVQNFWTPYLLDRPKFPFIFYDMPSKQDAFDAMLALPPIKQASDSGKLISTEVLQFGVYPDAASRNAARWGFFLAGDRITPALYAAAVASCKKNNGTNPRLSDPPKPVPANPTRPVSAAVTFDWEEKVDMLKQMKARGITIAGSENLPPQIATKQHYKAPSKDAALAFLKATPVDQPFYYLVVHTPDGAFGRDKDGIFEQSD